MFTILREVDGRWSVAVQNVEHEKLDRVAGMWRARGYRITWAMEPPVSR